MLESRPARRSAGRSNDDDGSSGRILGGGRLRPDGAADRRSRDGSRRGRRRACRGSRSRPRGRHRERRFPGRRARGVGDRCRHTPALVGHRPPAGPTERGWTSTGGSATSRTCRSFADGSFDIVLIGRRCDVRSGPAACGRRVDQGVPARRDRCAGELDTGGRRRRDVRHPGPASRHMPCAAAADGLGGRRPHRRPARCALLVVDVSDTPAGRTLRPPAPGFGRPLPDVLPTGAARLRGAIQHRCTRRRPTGMGDASLGSAPCDCYCYEYLLTVGRVG